MLDDTEVLEKLVEIKYKMRRLRRNILNRKRPFKRDVYQYKSLENQANTLMYVLEID